MEIESRETGCGGFRVLYDPQPRVRLLPGELRLDGALCEAVLRGLDEAPRLYAQALRTRPPARAWERAEVLLSAGSEVQGEALELGQGCIRLLLGESADPLEAAAIARHEALHLLLAASMPSGRKWMHEGLAFADWIVRGIESLREPVRLPRSAPVLEKLPRARGAPEPAQYGPQLEERFARASEQGRVRLAESALGAHFLEAAALLAEERALLPLILDDWLCDYEQYAHGIGNAPSGAGKLWRIGEPGFARDPLVRLSAAAAALACDDGCAFVAEGAAEPAVWKSRGQVRVPIVAREPGPRPAPLAVFRQAVRGDARALSLLTQAARGVERSEARALWPRVLARFIAAGWDAPEAEPSELLRVQPLDDEAHAAFHAAHEALRSLLSDFAAWLPLLEPVRPIEAVEGRATFAIVSSLPLDPALLAAAQRLAASQRVRAALFSDLLAGSAVERVPDAPPPLDPRYREELWQPAALPARLAELPLYIDASMRDGRVSSAAAHLLSFTYPGVALVQP